MKGKRLANRIVNECEKMGAEAVKLIDVRKRTPFFDFLVIATVDNTVLADALLRKVAKAVKLDADIVAFTESSPASDWVVCDYGDTVLHVFVGADVREHYNLEGLWSQPFGEKKPEASRHARRLSGQGVTGDDCGSEGSPYTEHIP